MTKEYTVIVQEILRREIVVSAESKEDAKNIIQRQYDMEEIILDAEDLYDTTIIAKGTM